MLTWDEDLPLFPRAERYLLSHNSRGRNLCLAQLPTSRRNHIVIGNNHLAVGLKLTPQHGFPVVQPYTPENFDYEVRPFTRRRQYRGPNVAYHNFANDDALEYPFWRNLEQTVHDMTVSYTSCVIAPDFSMYVDMPMAVNIYNVYRQRLATAYGQRCGLEVVPVASWGDANSLSYCFEGLPTDSFIAVCGIGHNHCAAATRLWEYAIRTLVEQKQPRAIIIYGGNDKSVPGVSIPFIYVPDQITKYFR